MGEVKLFGAFATPFPFRVQWALDHKGVQYEYIEEDLMNRSASFMSYSPPYTKVPLLIHNGKPISDSLCILEYIDETWSENPLLPKDPYERAMARFFAKFADQKCAVSVRAAFHSEGEKRDEGIEASLEALKILEGELQGKKFFGGETIGYLDLVVGWIPLCLPIIEEFGEFKLLDPQSFPSLCAWCENFLEVPLIKENLPPHDKMSAVFQYARRTFLSSAG
ncbi:glutathione transferase GST 23-like [Aristolochia californica]|uniref:glutathione transferase GST 23-like n=1 Tax=Aristolochia californica TaxID=171875 RepID=UPI0035DC8A44